jgi:hypothetical protein
MASLKVGDPLDPATEVGPLANEQILQGVDAQVKASVAAGAKLLTGGKRVDRRGFFYEPTVLVDVPPNSPAAREEIFGPVAAFFASAMPKKRSRSRTTAPSASAPASGRMMAASRSCSPPGWTSAWSFSTRWSRRIRGCRLAV